MKNVLYIVTFLCAMAHSDAQIVGDCTPPYDIATSLVDILVGEGVAYSNVTLSGFECAAGYFDGSNSNIALSSGLVMATDGVGAITPGGGVVTGGGAGVDSDLSLQLQLVNAGATNLNNLIVLEFDFIPTSNQVSFEYVFASNEYPGYTCSQYNDIFGFFISGPGINGPFSNNSENIALVPNPDDPSTYTNTPVIINTINSGTPSSGNSAPCDLIDPNWQDYSIFFTDNSAATTVSYPGFTVPLIAVANVQACETYHIKLAIADVADGILNSAVFLQEGSFNSFPELEVIVETNIIDLLNFDSEYLENIYEGCGPATITFIRPIAVQEEMIIEFSLSGSAINNVDYTLSTSSPNSIILPAGQQSISLQINSIYDLLPEGIETIDFELDVLEYGCFITQPTTITFNIYDQPLLDLSISDNGPQDCPGDELVLTVDANGGIGSLMAPPYPAPPYTFDWVGLGSSASQIVNPFQSIQYCIEVTDVCQDQELIECITVEVPDILVIESELVSNDMDVLNLNSDYDDFDVFEGCGSVTIDISSSMMPTDTIFINYNLSGSASLNSDYLLSNTIGNQIVLLPGQESISIDLDFLYDTIEEGEEFINLEIEMIEFSCSESNIFQFSIFDQPELQINLTDDLSLVCSGDEVIFEVEVEGGVGSLMSPPYSIQPYTTLWVGLDSNPLQIMNPSATTEYCVDVIDVCADQQLSDCLIIEVPIYDSLIAESELVYICSDEEVELCVYPVGGQGDYYYEWSNGGIEVCIFDYLGVYTVLVSDACGEQTSTLGEIYLDEAPEAIFEIEQIQAENLGVEFQNYTAYMSGLTYFWDFGDGTYSNQEQPIVHYYNSWGEYIVSLGVTTDLAGCYKEFSQEILVHPVLFFYAPNVFTPNNDNYNDVFKPSVVGAHTYELTIYDRWGRQIFITHDSNASWDGTYNGEALADGTYVFRVLITKLLDDNIYEREGHIILMR